MAQGSLSGRSRAREIAAASWEDPLTEAFLQSNKIENKAR